MGVRYIKDDGLVVARYYDDALGAISDLLGYDITDLTLDQGVKRLRSGQRKTERTIMDICKKPIGKRSLNDRDTLDLAVSWLHEALEVISDYGLDVDQV